MLRLPGFIGLQGRKEAEVCRSAFGGNVTGDITVVVTGGTLDFNIISLGCQMARGVNHKVHLLHVIEVPRVLPLRAILTQEAERADKLLKAGQEIAEGIGCEAVAEIVQARDAGTAIIDEVKDYHCALLILGLILEKKQPREIDKVTSYVLANAPCRVWLLEEPIRGLPS